MKFKELADHLDSKPQKPEKMSLDKFLSLLSPSERKELKQAGAESLKRSDPKNKNKKLKFDEFCMAKVG